MPIPLNSGVSEIPHQPSELSRLSAIQSPTRVPNHISDVTEMDVPTSYRARILELATTAAEKEGLEPSNPEAVFEAFVAHGYGRPELKLVQRALVQETQFVPAETIPETQTGDEPAFGETITSWVKNSLEESSEQRDLIAEAETINRAVRAEALRTVFPRIMDELFPQAEVVDIEDRRREPATVTTPAEKTIEEQPMEKTAGARN